MKKLICLVVLLIVCASFAATAIAAEGVFTPSVTAKPAPEIIVNGATDDGENVVGENESAPVIEVVNAKDETVEVFEVINVEVTPVSEKDEEYVPEEVRTVLTETYEQLSAPDVKLSVVMPKLVEVVEEAVAADATVGEVVVDELVVKDLFNVAVSEELAKSLEKEGNFLELTFDAKIAKDQFVLVMVCVDDEWVPVDFVVNEGGTITCKFDVVGVVAILVKA